MLKLKLKMKHNYKKRWCVSGLTWIVVFMLSSAIAIEAQTQQQVAGSIYDANGIPLPGVNVIQKGTNNGVSSDFDGEYVINLKTGSKTLVFSYVGYKAQEVHVGNENIINVTLEEDVASLDEVVVIGYAAIERKKVLGAMSGIKSESIEQATPVQVFEGVQGKLAGVQILTNNAPGSGFDIRVRGVSTFGSGTSPLYVVDGQQLEDIDNLDPADIASFEVLKDGASAAIYGSRAANGVVLITTKSGKSGDLSLEVTTTTGVNNLVGDLRVSNTKQRIAMDRARANDPTQLTTRELDSLSLLNRNSYDLQKLVMRPAIRHQTNLALSGGGEKTRFRWNTGFVNEEGLVRNTGYKRINTQVRLDSDATKTLKLGTRINLSYDEANGISETSVLQQLAERIPYYPLYEPDGSFTPNLAARANILAEAELRTLKNRNYRMQLFNYAELEILPKLKIRSTLGVNWRLLKRNDFRPQRISGSFESGDPNGREQQDMTYDIQQENILTYKNTWDKHDLQVISGMQIQKYFREYSDFRSLEFTNDLVSTFNNAAPGTITSNNFDERHNLYSLFAGFNYDFDDKYLVGATIRRDGSSRFGKDNKFGYFPSATLGWRVSNENFLKGNKTVNNLLIRAGYGVVGNERIANYDAYNALETGFTYNGISGIAPTRLGNSELGWEETTSTNLGLDLSMFKSRLEINIDLWKKETKDLLAVVPLPEESGYSGIRKNVGAVNNKGIDFNISGTILKTKNFSWSSNFNIGLLENEVVKLDGGVPFESGQYRIEEGQPVGNIFGYVNLGVFQYDESNAFTPEGVQLTPNFDDTGAFVNYTLNGSNYTGDVNQIKAGNRTLEGGDIIWKDTDGDFNITVDDREILGNGLSTIYGGFSHDLKYKNFSASVLFDYSLGQDIYRRWDETRNDLNSGGETPGPDRIEGAWRNPGDVTVYPRLDRVAQNRNRPNSFFVTDGSYIKWRYIKFRCNLSKDLLSRLSFVKKASINLAVNNVLTWTNYIGYNPEIGNRGNALQPNVDNLRYPNDREIILGLSVKF
ncbi:hypothetical protein BWZ22_11695 [Seonamhaeicola sp. S2-3]|uniref:SusC/RagA family TonB-linked outer membrane protein n=1 Tax=Seonamhaeicola sp. S2-3 TaxID=1936081 RepID=UPI00097287E5|nr:TonB-dependent receptor [Seonamhaeicola sp. S2-3]APY11855.1 hypothetical protein BWZ22_11695 [Seonamhaeicola sp. S2-3]